MKIVSLVLLAAAAFSNLHAESAPHPNQKMKVLSWNPRIFYYENFLSEEECDHLVKVATPELQRSTVVDSYSDKGVVDDVRTSRGMFMPYNHKDVTVRNIEERIANLTMMPIENGESIQVLAYSKGGEYKPHHDYFDGATVGGKASIDRGGQRVASFIMYLNTVAATAGGETIFPQVNLKVKPKKGDAVLFYDCNPDGKEDPLTLHGGAPVLDGEKWIATKWIRKAEFR